MTASTPTNAAVPAAALPPIRRVRAVVATSLAVTAIAGIAALIGRLVGGIDFLLMFAVLRWCVVAMLLAIPLLHQLVGRRIGLTLPYPLRTPATALLLTAESIGFDIISKHF